MVKGYCHYHLCERKGEVEQCPHCKKHFCSEHINPIEPGSYHPEKSRVLVNQIRLGHEKTHPCPDYVDYLEHQKKIQSHRWGKTLDRLTGRTPKGEEFEEDKGIVYQDNIPADYKKQQRINEKARLRIEKEKLAQEIEEKQKKHLKEYEKDEPYLYRYIPPEEQSRHPPKVQEKYKREQVVFERDGYVKRSLTEIRRYFKNKYHQIKHWSKNRPHRSVY